ncbi:hypothetical protein [Moorena sp. SIOASIH]|uniref:hypothetical protein n=1 Tax=Moorena sp. SIOASIH TaxID=2607817 RepID=UPI0025CE5B49|nr:hypothetical protein [Moorena sp. SIOASIH]
MGVSIQQSVVSRQLSVIEIKRMLTCCLDPKGEWGKPRQSLMGETTAVAHGGDHGSRSWGKPPRPRCLPKTALPPQDRTASPVPKLHRLFKSCSV